LGKIESLGINGQIQCNLNDFETKEEKDRYKRAKKSRKKIYCKINKN
jgi:hypothetical protein